MIKQNIIDLKNNYQIQNERSQTNPKITDSSSAFNYSLTSSQIGDKSPYWDLLSLDDVREHEKEIVKKREAKLRAQK